MKHHSLTQRVQVLWEEAGWLPHIVAVGTAAVVLLKVGTQYLYLPSELESLKKTVSSLQEQIISIHQWQAAADGRRAAWSSIRVLKK